MKADGSIYTEMYGAHPLSFDHFVLLLANSYQTVSTWEEDPDDDLLMDLIHRKLSQIFSSPMS